MQSGVLACRRSRLSACRFHLPMWSPAWEGPQNLTPLDAGENRMPSRHKHHPALSPLARTVQSGFSDFGHGQRHAACQGLIAQVRHGSRHVG